MAGIPKNQARTRNSIEQHEHEDDASARRVVFVSPEGNFVGYEPSAPLNVRLTDGSINIGTVNGELEVQLSAKDDDPDAGDVHDSVRIGDGEHELDINPDGSLSIQDNSTASIPQISTLTINNANTEVSTTLPQGTKFFRVKLRGNNSQLLISYTQGEIANSNFFTLTRGSIYEVKDINLPSDTEIYFQVDRSNQVVEIETWQ